AGGHSISGHLRWNLITEGSAERGLLLAGYGRGSLTSFYQLSFAGPGRPSPGHMVSRSRAQGFFLGFVLSARLGHQNVFDCFFRAPNPTQVFSQVPRVAGIDRAKWSWRRRTRRP